MALPGQIIRFVECRQNFFADRFGLKRCRAGLLAELFQQHDKFIATDARDGIDAAQTSR